MKIAFISDTHGFEGSLNIPKCDILVHCGDVCAGFGEMSAIDNIAYWFEQLKERDIVKEIILVAGNHDTNFLSKPEFSKFRLKKGCHFLQNSGIEIDGVKFYGTMFLDIIRNDDIFPTIGDVIESREQFYNNMPEDIDVLITHQPPDLDPLSITANKFNLGCPILKSAVERIKPKVHAFGHVHEGYGRFSDDTTTYINASVGYGDREVQVIEI